MYRRFPLLCSLFLLSACMPAISEADAAGVSVAPAQGVGVAATPASIAASTAAPASATSTVAPANATPTAAAPSAATIDPTLSAIPLPPQIFAHNSTAATPAPGVFTWQQTPTSTQPSGYIHSPSPLSGQVTITSRFRFNSEAGSQTLLLAGLTSASVISAATQAAFPTGPPNLLAFNLTVKPGWLSPITSLTVTGDATLFPAHLKVEGAVSNPTTATLLLTDNLVLESGELEASLSIDLHTGLTSLSLQAPSSGKVYFQGQLYLNSLKDQVYAGVGGFCDDCSQASWHLQLDHFSITPGIRRLGLPLALAQNVWVEVATAAATSTATSQATNTSAASTTTNSPPINNAVSAQDTLSVKVSGVGPGLPGSFRLVASAGVAATEVWQGPITSANQQINVPAGTLPPGRYQLQLEYVEPNYAVTVAQTSFELVAQPTTELITAQAIASISNKKEETNLLSSPVASAGYTLRLEAGPNGTYKPIRIAQLPFEASKAAQVSLNKVVVNPEVVIDSISPLLLGANTIYHLEKDAYWRSDLLPTALKNIKIGFLRYPGGSITSTYHWEKPTGRTWNEDPWSPSFDGQYENPANWMSFEEYMAIVKETGATPLVGVNVASGHKFNRVEEGIASAQAFLRYTLQKGYHIKHWFIDNEPYLPQSYVTLTPEEYSRYINLYSEALRAIDPEIKIIINWRQQWEPAWDTIFTLAGRNIDYIDLHSYWSWGTVNFTKWAGTPLMRGVKLTYEDTIKQFKSAIKRHKLDIKIGFFEWNIGPAESGAPYVSPYQAAIINAETLLQFVRGGADAAAFWPVHYDGQWSARSLISRADLNSGRLKTMPVYDVFSLYSSVLGDNLVYSQSDQPQTLVFAALNEVGNRLTVYLLRKDTSCAPVSLNWASFAKTGLAQAKVEVLSFTAPEGDLLSSEALVRELPWRLTAAANGIELAVEPYSLTRVVVELAQ